jgi:phosphohistidine phosphatase
MSQVPDYFYIQSAVLPYRILENHVEFLLVTSRGRQRWVLPKGVVEPELSAVDSATKEAWEEAGVEGIVSPSALGSYTYEKWGGLCNVQVFPMLVKTVSDSWPESTRERRWFEPEEAARRVDEPQLKELMITSATLLFAASAD